MKPSIGRIVIAKNVLSNGADEHPAIINRVWSDGDPAQGTVVAINVTVFPDCGAPLNQTSVFIFENRAAADAFLVTQGDLKPVVCFWPDRA